MGEPDIPEGVEPLINAACVITTGAKIQESLAINKCTDGFVPFGGVRTQTHEGRRFAMR